MNQLKLTTSLCPIHRALSDEQVRPRAPRLSAVIALCLTLTGCDRQYFHATGAIQSRGGDLGAWTSTPQGCSRDPFDGLPVSQSTSILTLLWDNPDNRDVRLPVLHTPVLDAPLRLEISRPGPSYAVTLTTVKTEGTQLDSTVCSKLIVDTRPAPPAIPEGRPTLRGTIQLDCHVKSSHITASIHFNRCEY